MANQEMYKHDALLHLVWTVAKYDENERETLFYIVKRVYLEEICKNEGIKIDMDDFFAKRKALKYTQVIIDEACKALRGCGKDWKIKCLGYMKNMARGSQVNDINNNIGDKEWKLIFHIQKELGLTDEELENSHSGLAKKNNEFYF